MVGLVLMKQLQVGDKPSRLEEVTNQTHPNSRGEKGHQDQALDKAQLSKDDFKNTGKEEKLTEWIKRA